jgi:hypothetical protein
MRDNWLSNRVFSSYAKVLGPNRRGNPAAPTRGDIAALAAAHAAVTLW